MESAWFLPIAGILIGGILGAAARWNHFCTLSALERYWYAGDDNGLRMWVLAIAVAMASTQALIAFDIISLASVFYLQPRLSLLGTIGGGIAFGLGMALVGTCGFGALVRLGGGSIRSLIIIVAIGLSALVAQRGVIGRLRGAVVEPHALDLSVFGSASIMDIVATITGLPIQALVAAIITLALLYWVLKESAFRHNRHAIIGSTIVGLCVTAGWVVTALHQNVSFEVVQLESASFVLPPGEVIFSLIAVTGEVPDYGIGLVLGVILGACVVAFFRGDMRWEACDDARELNRHLLGAFLMGTGGVFAGGCTIGQGVSASSTLAISAPIVFCSILIGARIGLRYLMEGSSIISDSHDTGTN